MGLKKGMTNNPAGRPPGSPNKVTKEIRDILKEFIDDNIDKIKKDFATLEAKDRIKIFVEILQYVIPRYHAIHSTIETERDFPDKIEIVYIPAPPGAPPPLREEPKEPDK